MTGKALSMEA